MSRLQGSARGSALVTALLVSFLLGALGLVYVALAGQQEAQAVRASQRERARAASRDVLELVASWLDPASRVPSPPASEWVRGLRRGDLDGDGETDAACDGRTEEGRFGGAAKDLFRDAAPERACGSGEAPDLLLEGSPWLGLLGDALGSDIVVLRVAVHAPPVVDGRRLAGATVSTTVSAGHGASRVLVRAEGHVVALPSLRGPDVVAADGDVVVEDGARVRWGAVTAGGDVRLPPRDSPFFPASGLPRGNDGRMPLDFSPGGVVDWDLRSASREYVLTELLGATRLGVRVPTEGIVPPRLPDPWLSLRAGGRVRIEGRDGDEPARARHPHPYDPEDGPVEEDLSHLSQGWTSSRAVPASAELLATAPWGSRVRRFFLAGPAAGEPEYREGGAGSARPASAWIRDAGPSVLLFLAGRRKVPESVTVEGGQGLVLVEARQVVLDPSGREPRVATVRSPGEVFEDTGIDADGDGLLDPETVNNGRWDVDADGDGRADEAPPPPGLFERVHARATPDRIPDDDRDPARLPEHPHEAFLNFAPASDDPSDAAVVVDFRTHASRGAGNLGDATDARDAAGPARAERLHFDGLLVNPAGGILVRGGFRLHGALRAAGDVVLEPESLVSHDEELGRAGWPVALPRVALVDFAWTGRSTPGRPEEAAEGGVTEPEDEAEGGASDEEDPGSPPPAEPERPGDRPPEREVDGRPRRPRPSQDGH